MIKVTLTVLLGFLVARSAAAEQFALDTALATDSVFFRSTAKLEFIEGKTAAIAGYFHCDPLRPDSAASGLLLVDLRTLKTGIDTRDEHMRERHLQTEDYPFAYFELTAVTGMEPLIAGKPDSGEAHGWFYIHGVKRELNAATVVTWYPDHKKIQVWTKFELLLDDFAIPRPKALFLKLAEKIEVECSFVGLNGLEPPVVSLPKWPSSR